LRRQFYKQNPNIPKPTRETFNPNPHHHKEPRVNPMKVYDQRLTKAMSTKKQLQEDRKQKTEVIQSLRDNCYKQRIDIIVNNRNNRYFIKNWLCILLIQRLTQSLNSKRKSSSW
jgi:hypothetical protein